ncbi:unnamed protein product [Hydatigera taeniaeformis]|uniref:Receptor protein-tyrosine kinase n=1 Tax=Hydatigena taeniaeformis TaxID=6205 RepID=A0A0R3WLP5_HYDTA|nr:unnamed protein product [Hydatigera taeniaeformis]
MPVKNALFVQYICLAVCFHIKDLEDSGDSALCEDYKRSQIVVLEDAIRESPRINTTVPPAKIQVRQAFRGERVALRCLHTKRGSKYAWYLSATAPVGSSILEGSLIPLPRNSCFQRHFYNYKAFGVEVVEVVAQRGTVGYFTCAENVDENHWIQRGVFLILLYQRPTVVLQVDLVSTSEVDCETAASPLSYSSISFGGIGVPQIVKAEDSECIKDSKSWHCTKFIGEWDGFEWVRKRLEMAPSGFIYTGPLGRAVRLRFEMIQVGFRLDFVRLVREKYLKLITLGSFELTQDSLCVEARQVGRRLDWMVLETYMGYAKLAGGFRIPFGKRISPGDFEILDGLQLYRSEGGSFGSVFLEQTLDPQAVLERTLPIPHEVLLPPPSPPQNYQPPRPCSPPLTSSGHGFVSIMYNQLCTQKATTFTTVLTGDVTMMPRGSDRSVIVKIEALLMNRESQEDFYRLRWNESGPTDSREDLRDWFKRMEFKTASKNVSIIYKNSWPVCAVGQHLAIPNPPLCVPCPPGTKATVYKSIDKASHAPEGKQVDFNTPHAILCDLCPEGAYQPEPGQTKCFDCSTSYNPYFCAKTPLSIILGGSVEETPPLTGAIRSEVQPRKTTTIGIAGVLLICLCMVGLLACVVYFYLEAIGFMLVKVARASYAERPVQKTRPSQICEAEIRRLEQLHPEIDLHELARQELCQAEILGLRVLHPEIDWEKIVCEAEVRRLQEDYPFIHWEKVLHTELPYVLRARYPFIDWNRIVAEDACGREIERLKAENPDMDWTIVLCEARIESLQRKFPCINWGGIVCEERIRRLRSAYPSVDFDQLVRDELCEEEMEQLKLQHPEIDWEAIVCAEQVLWLKARHPMVHWENIVSEDKIVRLRHLYPYIDWSNVIRNNLCEKEIIGLRKRFPQLDWESIVRGGDASVKRLSKAATTERLSSRFPDVTWSEIITEDLSDYAIKRWREKYPWFDWDAITMAIFQPITLKSVNFKSPEVCKSFREQIGCLEELYPCVDWRYFVEKKYASPYINWDYIIRREEEKPAQESEKLNPKFIDRLNSRYQFVNWSAFQNAGIEKMRREHPYIHWTVVLEENDLDEGQTLDGGNVEPMTPRKVSPIVPFARKTEERIKLSRVAAEEEILRLRREYPHINWENVIAKERRQKIIEHDPQCGDSKYLHDNVPTRQFPDKIRSDTEAKIGAITPSTEVVEINCLKTLYPSIKWTGVVDHELRKRRKDREE